MSEDRHSEVWVCGELGLLRNHLSDLRRDHLEVGADYEVENRRAWYTARGLAKLRGIVAGLIPVPAPPPAPVLPEEPEEPEEPEPSVPVTVPSSVPVPVVMFVERLCPNPTWVKCRNEVLALVDVRVMDNRYLRRGQRLTVVPDGGGRFVALRERG